MGNFRELYGTGLQSLTWIGLTTLRAQVEQGEASVFTKEQIEAEIQFRTSGNTNMTDIPMRPDCEKHDYIEVVFESTSGQEYSWSQCKICGDPETF